MPDQTSIQEREAQRNVRQKPYKMNLNMFLTHVGIWNVYCKYSREIISEKIRLISF